VSWHHLCTEVHCGIERILGRERQRDRETETDTETERETETQRHRDTETDRDRQRQRETERNLRRLPGGSLAPRTSCTKS